MAVEGKAAEDTPGGSSWQVRSPAAKFLSGGEIDEIVAEMDAGEGDLLLIVADASRTTLDVLGRLRTDMGRKLGLTDDNVLAFAWVIDPPLVEWNEAEGRWDPNTSILRWTGKSEGATFTIDDHWATPDRLEWTLRRVDAQGQATQTITGTVERDATR